MLNYYKWLRVTFNYYIWLRVTFNYYKWLRVTFDYYKCLRVTFNYYNYIFFRTSIRLIMDAHIRFSQMMPYNVFVTLSVSSPSELPAGLIAIFLADRLGRRNTLMAALLGAGLVEMTIAFTNTGDGGPQRESNFIQCRDFVSTKWHQINQVWISSKICSEYRYKIYWDTFSHADNSILQMVLYTLGMLIITLGIEIALMIPVEVLPTVLRTQACCWVNAVGFWITAASPYIYALVSKWTLKLPKKQ